MKRMLEKNNKIRQKQQKVEICPQLTEQKETLKIDEKRRSALTEKLTFEICASLIAYEVKAILGTINRQRSDSGKRPAKNMSNNLFQV